MLPAGCDVLPDKAVPGTSDLSLCFTRRNITAKLNLYFIGLVIVFYIRMM